MRNGLPVLVLGLGFVLHAACGAGGDSDKRGSVGFGEGGEAGEGAGATGNTGGVPGQAGGPASGGRVGGAGGATGGAPAVVETCSDISQCDTGEVCYVGLGGPEGTCRATCAVSFSGEQGSCDTDEVCVESGDGSLGACLRQCDPAAGGSECGAGDWCELLPDPGLTGDTQYDGLCVAATGTATLGESCSTEQCAAGLDCYAPAFDRTGTPHCEPICEPGAASDEPGACAEGETCRAVNRSNRGVCIEICDPFTNSSCSGSETCFPFDEWDGTMEIVEGQCIVPGSVAEGEPCAAGDCAGGLVCTDFGAAESKCRSVCSTTGASDCGSGTCAPILNQSLELGACIPGCSPFGEGQAAGCGDDEWCAPTDVPGTASCVPAGSRELGGTCSEHGDCVAGGYCECEFGAQSFCTTTKVCDQRCDPAAASGDPGSCTGSDTCVPKSVGGELLPYGVCREACEFDGAATCTDTAQTCVSGDLLDSGRDACMDIPASVPDPGEFCGAPALDFYDPCGETALCLISEIDGDPECVDVCRVSAGAIGSSGHPDCASAAAVCTRIAPGLDYGRCLQ